MQLATAQQMRELERRSDAAGNTYAEMMEHAGTLAAQAIMDRWQVRERRVLVLVGPGNNGGDGLVCARVLHDAGAAVRLYLCKRAPDDTDANWRLCRARGIPYTLAEEDTGFAVLRDKLAGAAYVIDALLGTGVSRPLEGILGELLLVVKAQLAEMLTSASLLTPGNPASPLHRRPIVVAMDLPTGLNPDTGELDPATVPADLTITFALPKIGHYSFPGAGAVGELVVADIGIKNDSPDPLAPHVATSDEILAFLPARPRDANKGTFGKAMLAGGSLHYTGAPVLAARAAARVGAGLVTLAVPQTIHPIVAAKIDEATFLPVPDRLGDWRPRSANELLAVLWDAGYDALLVGCGLGLAVGAAEFLERLLEGLPALEDPPPLVVDADGLNHLANIPEWWTRFPLASAPILTPHPGEMARLLGTETALIQQDRLGTARSAAATWHAVVVLKGAFTVVASPQGDVTLIPFANPALATAGTGDVLAGTIVGLLAQFHARAHTDENYDVTRAAYRAALAGAYLHALAGDIAATEIGDAGVIAGDLIPRLPVAIRRVKCNG
jgi:NAD(P)H-hydrate epimerase